MTITIGNQVIIYDHTRPLVHCLIGVVVKVWWRSRPNEQGRWVYEVELPTGIRIQCRDYHLVKTTDTGAPIEPTEQGE